MARIGPAMLVPPRPCDGGETGNPPQGTVVLTIYCRATRRRFNRMRTHMQSIVKNKLFSIFHLPFMALLAAALLASPPLRAQEEALLRIYVMSAGQENALLPSDDTLTHRLDLAALTALPQETFQTSTIWTEGVQAFSGVPLTALLDWLEVEDGTVMLIAQNDYQIRIPVKDIKKQKGLLAHHRNGKAMSLRDKGPLWLVYPYDSAAIYRSETIYAQSIWQLDRIVILP